MHKHKNQSKWKRKLTNQEKIAFSKIRIKIKKKTQTGVKSSRILYFLHRVSNFFGCFAEDEVQSLALTSFPAYLIINLDPSHLPGSHWLAMRVDQKTVEVFDPAGFELMNWPRIPCSLLTLIHRLTSNRSLLVSKRTQSPTSNLCGFYCMFYVILRQHLTLKTIESFFSTNLSRNDTKLIKFFQ